LLLATSTHLDWLEISEALAMLLRTGCWTLLIWLSVGEEQRAAAEPPSPDEITVIHDIVYREGPSRQRKLDLAMKKGSRAAPRPGIVVIHGGGWIEGDKSSFASRDHGVPGNIVDFAALGFVSATIN
jgi:acetyl esterase/lipase